MPYLNRLVDIDIFTHFLTCKYIDQYTRILMCFNCERIDTLFQGVLQLFSIQLIRLNYSRSFFSVFFLWSVRFSSSDKSSLNKLWPFAIICPFFYCDNNKPWCSSVYLNVRRLIEWPHPSTSHSTNLPVTSQRALLLSVAS